MRIFAFSLAIGILGASATTYPKLTTKQFRSHSDVNVIGTIVSQNPTYDEDGKSCGSISEVNVYYSFTNGIKAGDKITIDTYREMDKQDVYLLYLTSTKDIKDLKTSSNSMHLNFEEEERIRCKNARKPAYQIMMEGLGSLEIVQGKSRSIDEGHIEFTMNWVVPPEELIGVSTGSGWDEIKKVKTSDFISHFERN
ncbi:hypothetical protein [Aliikangiella sp. IMCC44632]